MKWSFIKLSDEAQSAARWLAQRGYSGKTGDPLPELLSQGAETEINQNIIAFRLSIHLFRAYEFHN